MKEILVVNNLGKKIEDGSSSVTILEDINIRVKEKEFVAIMGPSGSGKSTLLGILSGLDDATSGSVQIDGVNICHYKEDKLTDFRSKYIGVVFQSPNLIPVLNGEENIELPLFFTESKNPREKVCELLRVVGLDTKGKLMPPQLSGGEQQRIAIARALVREPIILFADEPTGALDSINGDKIIQIFEHFRQKYSMTIVLVTHDKNIAEKADRIIHLKDGRIMEESC